MSLDLRLSNSQFSRRTHWGEGKTGVKALKYDLSHFVGCRETKVLCFVLNHSSSFLLLLDSSDLMLVTDLSHGK